MLRSFLGPTTFLAIVVFNAYANAATTTPTPSMATPRLKISGQTSFNSWFFDNKRKIVAGNAKNEPCSRQKFGRTNLFSVDNSRLKFNVDGKTDPGMDYGLVIVLDGNTNATKAVREDYLYFGGSWGKIYAGDTYGVQDTMAFGGFDQWGGTGFVSGGNFDRVVNYTTGTLHSVDLVGDTSRDTKLTYFSPRWKGAQLGVSYTPRAEHRGEQQVSSWTSQSTPKKPFDVNNIASGINFIHKFESGFEMALSGTSIFAETHPEFHGAPKRKHTASFAFGGTFSYGDVGFSAEYGNNGRSQQFENRKTNAGQFIDFGLSYKWDAATKLSAGYYHGWRKSLGGGIDANFTRRSSKTNAVGAAIDRKLARGLGVYFEYANFQMKNPAATAEASRINSTLTNCGQFVGPTKSNRANVFVVGSRLVF